eukprot:comp33715_c0_seq1/m.47286 comp33715_c0_seq1/g.47286  ORF comp33715_c0_seq1/g.47286 comp33715_c0_seq1/m.47286 type:complete len:181 (-) comp33715_c0_seq1:260-802(-)
MDPIAALNDLMAEVEAEMEVAADEKHTGFCAGCKKSIVKGDKNFVVSEKKYHKDCLACKTCKKSVATEGFFLDGPLFVCEPCYVQQKAEKCTACQGNITGMVVRIKDRPYHLECFKCKKCQKNLNNIGFFTLPEGEWVCEGCQTSNYPVCAACNKTIVPDRENFSFVRQGPNSYHTECAK